MHHPVPHRFWLCVTIVSVVACASTSSSRPSETAGPTRAEAPHRENSDESEPAPESPPVRELAGSMPEGEESSGEASATIDEEASHGRQHGTVHPQDGDTVMSERDEAASSMRAAYQNAKPVFDAHCASCHTSRGSKSSKTALKHLDMDTHPFGGHHAQEVTASIRKVLGADGSKPTMPRDRPGAVQGEELALILAWAEAYDRAQPQGAHEPAGPKHQH